MKEKPIWGLGSKITALRAEGKSYKEICKILNCHKSRVCYHCGAGQKQRRHTIQKRERATDPLNEKIRRFRQSKPKAPRPPPKTKPNIALMAKILKFQRVDNVYQTTFGKKEVLAKIGPTPTCYLTGRSIDLNKPTVYSLDHHIPLAKGGSNLLDNLELACRDANQAKGSMLVEEFLSLCREVLCYHGYTITPPQEKVE